MAYIEFKNVEKIYKMGEVDLKALDKASFEIEGDNNTGTYGTDVVSIHIFEYNGDVKIIYDYLEEKYSQEEITNINNSIINIIKQISENNSVFIEDIKI